MKILLTYSSLTGNTKKVADGIHKVLKKYETTYLAMNEIHSKDFIDRFDIVIVGCWVDKGMPNKEALDFMKMIKNKKVGLFVTLGAYPDSQHAKGALQRCVEKIEENRNIVIAKFICQGKISEKLINFFKTLPPDHPHALTEEKLRGYEMAAKHPDEEDIRKAQEVFSRPVELYVQ
ncbi:MULTISPECIES: flavodoxin family protein [Pseudothermotoga]|jgi:flavodoxin|uniref:Flavodoxin family protein n=1 Tax=Pseudothermotoga lettingae (strain ATCC BAA-301 / DSM 14385 / NBRC 107922 / TMO) TaxID=416591 RepID=A8F6M3_PSELT|nr:MULTISPECIES: flavodoxin family protein [Pseudothermotoga]ABV33807.1 flavodoxin family protein [Pseudothermotoga lettingae TMO]MDI3495411.1 hypothetical protein [Pseudothermotoga sp.]MDK2884367.1 hypothetical protein [Pseudothermotoga sp.]GLI49259.1 flavodoxin [Pseudothermotoga lettingae TMO]